MSGKDMSKIKELVLNIVESLEADGCSTEDIIMACSTIILSGVDYKLFKDRVELVQADDPIDGNRVKLVIERESLKAEQEG